MKPLPIDPANDAPASDDQRTNADYVITPYSDLASAETVWRELENGLGCFVFQTYDWLSTWQSLIGDRQRVEPCPALVETAEGHPLMFLPLGIQRRMGGRVLVWLGGDLSDYGAPMLIEDPAAVAAIDMKRLWHALCRALPPFDYACLERQPEHVVDQPNPFLQLPTRPHPFQTHRTRLAGDWQGYYAEKRGRKSRATDRRKARKLEAMGTIDFLIAREPAVIDRLLAALFKQKSRRLQDIGAHDLFQMAGNRDFFARLAHDQIDRGLIHLSAITLDDQVVAVHFGALHKRRFYILLPAFIDGEIAQWSPGNLLFMRLFAWAFDHDVEVMDFTIGDEPYKTTWCETRDAVFASHMPVSFRGYLAVAWIRSALAIKARLRTSDVLRTIVSTIRRQLSRRAR